MKKLFVALTATLVTATGFASTSLTSQLSSALGNGSYAGLTEQGEACSVSVHADVERSLYSVAVTPASFKFGEDLGSTKCMYSKSCFAYSQRVKILDQESSATALTLQIKAPGGGVDYAMPSKMALRLSQTTEGLKVEVAESVGLFNLRTTKAECTIKQ